MYCKITFHLPQARLSDLIEACETVGSFVAEIREEKANDAIFQIGKEFTPTKGIELVIGSGSDETEEGKWLWASDGQQFIEITKKSISAIPGQYSNWHMKGTGHELKESRRVHHCLTMISTGNAAGKWMSARCGRGKRVVCEAKAVSGKTLDLLDLPEDF